MMPWRCHPSTTTRSDSFFSGCYPMLDLAQIRTLLLAERSREVAVLTEAVDAVLATSLK